MLVRPNLGLFTQPISAIGLPVCVAPMAAMGDLPIGIQIIAKPWRENLCLRVARVLEAAGVSAAHLPRISETIA
jgi:aspartyl-tRNA(Asn)/glutamyl-tRNA(Gln) amidotransferase subunit A